MLHFCAWLQNNSLLVAINNSIVLSAIMEVAHYAGFFLLVGTIAIVDLRVLGIAGRRQNVGTLGAQLFPWMWVGLTFAFLSGFVMFSGDAADFYLASVFRIKIAVILLAVIFGIIVQWNTPKWGQLPSLPVSAKLLALISLVLWIGAILASVEVPAISGVG
ncbi:MAG TPA: hypothetical protein VFM21_11965 [Terriglobia bacterium]|nr:hypothetical protein [Terriglobia bacterium]